MRKIRFRYFNSKPLIALLMAGGIALTCRACSKEEEEMPDFKTTVTSAKEITCYDEYLESATVAVRDTQESEAEEIALLDAVETLQEQFKVLDILPEDIVLDSSIKNDTKKIKLEHTIKWGENYRVIANYYGITEEQIRKENKSVIKHGLLAGEVLTISAPTFGTLTLEEAEALVEKYKNFDDLDKDEKIKLLNDIVDSRNKVLTWVRINGPKILEQVAFSTIKCKALDACGLNEESYPKVTISSESEALDESGYDITVEDCIINKNGSVQSVYANLDSDLSSLQSDLYSLQTISYNLSFTQYDADKLRSILESALSIIPRPAEHKDGWFESSKSTIKLSKKAD